MRQAEADHYACAWSKDVENGTPLLCVSGSNGKIKIIDALSGKLLRVGESYLMNEICADSSRF